MRFHLFKRGSWWWLDWRHRGARHREPTGTSKRTEADAFLEKRRSELGDPAYVPRTRSEAALVSVADTVTDFRLAIGPGLAGGTVSMYRAKAGHLARLLGEKGIATLTREDWDGYLEKRKTEGAVQHTLAKEVVTARRMMEFAQGRGLVDGSWRGQIPKVKAAYVPRDRWLTEAEVGKLVVQVPVPRRLWALGIIYLGGRVSEMLRLTWPDVDFRQGWVTLRTAKVRAGNAYRPRRIPLHPDLARALRAAAPKEGRGAVFIDPWKNPALELTRNARRAGICGTDETVCNNDLRRTFASWMLQQGATVKEVADLLGHRSTAMVERVYGHLAAANLVRAVARLPTIRIPRRGHKTGTRKVVSIR